MANGSRPAAFGGAKPDRINRIAEVLKVGHLCRFVR
jgi:hypothetical protein